MNVCVYNRTCHYMVISLTELNRLIQAHKQACAELNVKFDEYDSVYKFTQMITVSNGILIDKCPGLFDLILN